MRKFLWVAVGTLAVTLAAPAASADVHKDTDLGFQINVVKDWTFVPVSADEKWIIAKFLGDRDYGAKKEGYLHRPHMEVILFPSEALRNSGAKVKAEEDKITITLNNPYKDYKDFLSKNSYGGYFISKEEESTVNGIKTTVLEVKFEKLTVPRRVAAWIFHGEDADYAVQYEALEDHWEKLNREFVASLKTFKIFPRAKALPSTTPGDTITIEKNAKEMTPEERAKKRQEKFEQELRTSVERLPKDWTTKRSKNYVAISHVDEKYTQRTLDRAEAVRAWLELNFVGLSPDPAGPVIIRICATSDEARAFMSGSGYSFGKREMTTYKDVNEGRQSIAAQYVSKGVMSYWFRDKHPSLWYAMPGWVDSGLDQFVMTAVAKGTKLEFKPDSWEGEQLREASNKGKLTTVKNLVSSTWESFSEMVNPMAQSGAFVRFLMVGPGSKNSRTKEVMRSYVRSLVDYLREQDEKDKKKDDKENKPTTEEEEEAQFKARQQEWKQREKELLDEIFKRTFGSWTEDDWKAIEKAWLGAAG